MPRVRGKAYANDRQQAETLCWYCANACGGCSWSKKLVPVDGWVTRARGPGEDVVACPKFVADGRERHEPKVVRRQRRGKA